MRRRRFVCVAATGLALLACGGSETHVVSADEAAQPIGEAECGACGMIVREQLSPRGQVVHHDGTHVWLCSIGDLVAYLGAPSPHGRIEQIWVEVLPADFDLAHGDTAERPWVLASSASYVLGVSRMVMGTPALAFASASEASAVAQRVSGRVATWDETMHALGSAE